MAEKRADKGNEEKEARPPAPAPAAKPAAPPKPVIDVAATSVFNKLGNGVYLESQRDIERFIDALKAELEAAIKQDKRVRIR